MRNQGGMTLTEVLVSLFLGSLIVSIFMQIYLSNKMHINKIESQLETHFDIQWVHDLLSDSIRQAGFTPCFSLDQLRTVDTRNSKHQVNSISTINNQSIRLERMNEEYTKIIQFMAPNQILISEDRVISINNPLIISDCFHAEIHSIEHISKTKKGFIVRLNKPLVFSYYDASYAGAFVEEAWFIKKGSQGKNALYYKSSHTEEVSPSIHSLSVQKKKSADRVYIDLILGLKDTSYHKMTIVVRNL